MIKYCFNGKMGYANYRTYRKHYRQAVPWSVWSWGSGIYNRPTLIGFCFGSLHLGMDRKRMSLYNHSHSLVFIRNIIHVLRMTVYRNTWLFVVVVVAAVVVVLPVSGMLKQTSKFTLSTFGSVSMLSILPAMLAQFYFRVHLMLATSSLYCQSKTLQLWWIQVVDAVKM